MICPFSLPTNTSPLPSTAIATPISTRSFRTGAFLPPVRAIASLRYRTPGRYEPGNCL